MFQRLLAYLRCPGCEAELQLEALDPAMPEKDTDISLALLHCAQEHWFPVVRGIPRMLPDAVEEHWEILDAGLRGPEHAALRAKLEKTGWRAGSGWRYDERTRQNYSLEWDHHAVGDRTWGIELQDRVQWFFLDVIGIPVEDLEGKVMLDAGCGNGSQSVAYTEYGLEVIALDLSSGLEHGLGYRQAHPGARPDRVHFVQGDLQSPPLARSSVDLIHSAGVLQATPNTETTFRRLCALLKPGATFYVWVLKYEPIVTPLVNGLRTVTTRIPPRQFAKVARVMAPAFQLFCQVANKAGIRSYTRLDREEAALGLMDIFGSPYAHYHTFDEVAGWYRSEGFDKIWPCNDDRRGFGVCGTIGVRSTDLAPSGRSARRQVPSRRRADRAPAVRTRSGTD